MFAGRNTILADVKFILAVGKIILADWKIILVCGNLLTGGKIICPKKI